MEALRSFWSILLCQWDVCFLSGWGIHCKPFAAWATWKLCQTFGGIFVCCGSDGNFGEIQRLCLYHRICLSALQMCVRESLFSLFVELSGCFLQLDVHCDRQDIFSSGWVSSATGQRQECRRSVAANLMHIYLQIFLDFGAPRLLGATFFTQNCFVMYQHFAVRVLCKRTIQRKNFLPSLSDTSLDFFRVWRISECCNARLLRKHEKNKNPCLLVWHSVFHFVFRVIVDAGLWQFESLWTHRFWFVR